MRDLSSLATIEIAGPGAPRLARSLADVLASAFLMASVIVASVLGSTASVLGSELLPTGRIAAALAAASVRSPPLEPARHQCRCGTDCGGSCCCNRHESGRAATTDNSGVL